MNYFLGMDPDTSKQSAVIVDEDGKVAAVFMVKAPRGVKGRDAAVWMASVGATELIKNVGAWAQREEVLGDLTSLAIEGQQIYQHETGCKSQDVVNLALVAGGLMSATAGLLDDVKRLTPLPKQWKASVPKHIHQCRTMKKAGLAYEKKGGNVAKNQYPVPLSSSLDASVYKGPDKVNPGDWKDVTDSLGLALWARDQWAKEQYKHSKKSWE